MGEFHRLSKISLEIVLISHMRNHFETPNGCINGKGVKTKSGCMRDKGVNKNNKNVR